MVSQMGALLQNIAWETGKSSSCMLVLISHLASCPFFFFSSLSILRQFPPPTYSVPDICAPQSPTLLFCPCHCIPSPNTLSFIAAKCHFWNNRRTCCFCDISGKKIFDPFGVKSTHKKCIQGPSPASFTGVVHIWWLVIEQARHFPPEMSLLLSSVSSFLRLPCLSDNAVFEAQQFLIYFQTGDPSWSSPFSGLWTRFSGKPWGNMVKSGLFLWATRWRERLETLCSPLDSQGQCRAREQS